MAEYIERQAAIDAVRAAEKYRLVENENGHWRPIADSMEAMTNIVDLPAADVTPVKRTKCRYCKKEWGTCDPVTNHFIIPPNGKINFCPMCGAKMDEEAQP